MIWTIVNTSDFAVVVGVDFRRWFVGVSFEKPNEFTRVAVFRFLPFYIHLIHQPPQ